MLWVRFERNSPTFLFDRPRGMEKLKEPLRTLAELATHYFPFGVGTTKLFFPVEGFHLHIEILLLEPTQIIN